MISERCDLWNVLEIINTLVTIPIDEEFVEEFYDQNSVNALQLKDSVKLEVSHV